VVMLEARFLGYLLSLMAGDIGRSEEEETGM
jgi:hypothetical protein